MQVGERIIVLGGGVIGLSCALALAGRGHDVSILETGFCGGQASGAARHAGALLGKSRISGCLFRLCLDSLRGTRSGRRKSSGCPAWISSTRKAAACMPLPRSGFAGLVGAAVMAAAIRHGGRNRGRRPVGAVGAADETGAGGCILPEESHVYAPDYVRALEAACRAMQIREQCGS